MASTEYFTTHKERIRARRSSNIHILTPGCTFLRFCQATLKKKLIKEGLLDEKGKPNEKTPADWRTRYQELTHYGPKDTSGVAAGDGDGSGSSVSAVPPQQDGQGQEEGKQHKKKKKKSRDQERESE